MILTDADTPPHAADTDTTFAPDEPAPRDPLYDLDHRQLTVISMLTDGDSVEYAADLGGVPSELVYAWLQFSPAFISRLNWAAHLAEIRLHALSRRCATTALEATANRLAMGHPNAVKELLSIKIAPPPRRDVSPPSANDIVDAWVDRALDTEPDIESVSPFDRFALPSRKEIRADLERRHRTALATAGDDGDLDRYLSPHPHSAPAADGGGDPSFVNHKHADPNGD